MLQDRLDRLSLLLLQSAAGSACIAALLAMWLARRATRPLPQMASVANQIAKGDYDQRVSESGDKEFDILGDAINRMAGELQGRLANLTDQRNRLEAVFAGMAEGVVAIDSDERLVLLNRALRPANSTFHPVSKAGVLEICRIHQVPKAMSQALEDDQQTRSEFRLTDRGRDQALGLSCGPIHDDDGRVIGAIAVLNDTTDTCHLEQVRQDFVANVSHELKTPLTAIRGIVETMLDDQGMPNGVRSRFLGKVQTHAPIDLHCHRHRPLVAFTP